MFMDPYFIWSDVDQSDIDSLQKQALLKQKHRIQSIGELLRSKGFIWIASTNMLMGGLQQAGNILR